MENKPTAIGIETWGKGSRKTRGKRSKLEIIQEIGSVANFKNVDINALTIKELNLVLKAAEEHKTYHTVYGEISGNLKSPYVKALAEIESGVMWSKLPVSSLKNLTEIFKWETK